MGDPQISPNNSFSGYVLTADNGVSRLGTISRYERRFFVKSLVPEYADHNLYRLQLNKEFKMLMELNHPGIVRVYELCDIPEIGYSILMEYLQGENLSKYLKHHPSGNERRRIADSIVDALEYVHSKGVIHGDLKPDNIMVNPQTLSVKLIDFGLSDTEDYTLLKIPGGTRDYVPPESKMPGYKINQKSDVYALGRVIQNLKPGLPYMLAARRAYMSNSKKRLADALAFKRLVRRYRTMISWAAGLFIAAVSIVALILFLGSNATTAKTVPPPVSATADSVETTASTVDTNLEDTAGEGNVSAEGIGMTKQISVTEIKDDEYYGFSQADEDELLRKLELAQNNAYARGLGCLATMEIIRTSESYNVVEKALKMRSELLEFYKNLTDTYQDFAKDIPEAMYKKYGYDWNPISSWPAVSLYSKGTDMLEEFAEDNKITSVPDM